MDQSTNIPLTDWYYRVRSELASNPNMITQAFRVHYGAQQSILPALHNLHKFKDCLDTGIHYCISNPAFIMSAIEHLVLGSTRPWGNLPLARAVCVLAGYATLNDYLTGLQVPHNEQKESPSSSNDSRNRSRNNRR
jgi:hypothetical protein